MFANFGAKRLDRLGSVPFELLHVLDFDFAHHLDDRLEITGKRCLQHLRWRDYDLARFETTVCFDYDPIPALRFETRWIEEVGLAGIEKTDARHARGWPIGRPRIGFALAPRHRLASIESLFETLASVRAGMVDHRLAIVRVGDRNRIQDRFGHWFTIACIASRGRIFPVKS